MSEVLEINVAAKDTRPWYHVGQKFDFCKVGAGQIDTVMLIRYGSAIDDLQLISIEDGHYWFLKKELNIEGRPIKDSLEWEYTFNLPSKYELIPKE